MRQPASWKLVLTGTFFCLYLAVQIAIPARALYRGKPSQFSWFMFTGHSQKVTLILHFDDGRSVPLRRHDELRKRTAFRRLDADRERFLPPFLCEVEPSLERVTIHWRGVGVRSEYTCVR